MKTILAHLRLMRPANIITAIADILAGFAISGAALHLFSADFIDSTLFDSLLWLILSTIGLYGGGIVFNDVFDAELDRRERPERPIPSGKASIASASLLAGTLLITGIAAAWQVSLISGIIAVIVATLAVLYDAWGKHQLIFGPLNMGLCRGGNLLLGISVLPEALQDFWFVAIIPIIYIAAITMISRGEVFGGNKKVIIGGIVMYSIIIFALVFLSIFSNIDWWHGIPFVLLFSFLIFPPVISALKLQEPQLIKKAVKAGILSLVVLNAALSAAFAGWIFGILVLLLLPVSVGIAKKFSVT
ncbi:4-hydroxybenzoate polyprenyltransferase [Salegentibacter sp. 24]|uniref:UbiA-like protein EboC n=1 Tax=Salegentibacter sp. 24 TaxID=2183986 RepID=UPI001060AC5A|nr:UbiA-like protein EboC [Salegentibacter sp. 24]TDN95066.1 4-hydroxybenzoate polyprenyltransferase [Salegentibacter sp. 24]